MLVLLIAGALDEIACSRDEYLGRRICERNVTDSRRGALGICSGHEGRDGNDGGAHLVSGLLVV